MNNQERINKITDGNNILINKSYEELEKSSYYFRRSVERISDELKFDNDEKKSEIKELLLSLSEEINSTYSIEEIDELRKKINYLINKVKKEIEKKDINIIPVDNFVEATTNFRKSIAKNIRYLKRVNNIEMIESLNSNYDNLNEEELLNLKKMIKREQNYNHKNLNPSKKEVKKEIKNEESIKVSNLKVNQKVIELNTHNKVNENVNKIKQVYKLNRLPEYDKSLGENFITFVKTIPTYIKNKKIISSIDLEDTELDEKTLNGFVEYSKKRNSIRLTLKEIVKPKYRKSIESLYLRNDNYCSYWIKNIYNNGVVKSLRK